MGSAHTTLKAAGRERYIAGSAVLTHNNGGTVRTLSETKALRTTDENQEYFYSLDEVGAALPAVSDTMLCEARLIDTEVVSCRLVRIDQRLPLHSHNHSDENVYVLQGRAIFQLHDDIREISPGMFIHFPKNAVHGILQILESPLLALTIDTPRRPKNDVVFLHPEEGDPQSFSSHA